MLRSHQRPAPTVRRRRRAAALVLAFSLVALAACGGDDSDDTTDPTSGGGATPSGSTGGPTTAPDDAEGVVQTPRGEALKIGEPRQGGEAVFGLEGGFQRIDPAGVTSNPLTQIFAGVFGHLMTQNDEGDVVPGMAESMESDDFKTWTMTLREGINFSDGTPFNADAVVQHMNRLKDPATKYPYAAILNQIATITATGDLTVEFGLEAPFPRFPLVFTYQGPAFVPSPTAIKNPDFGLRPVGAGPFLVQSVTPDAEVVMVRNPDYWEEGLPYLDKITFIPISDSEAKLAALQTGDIDGAFTLSDQDFARGEEAGLKVLNQRSFTNQCTMHNAEKPPFDDIRVRRGLALAIDNDAINEVVYGGVREVPTRIWPESHPYSTEIENWPSYDPEEAKRLIDEYVAEKGPLVFDISVNIQPEFQQVWTIILQMWEQVGAKANMTIMDQAEHVNQANTGNYQSQGRYCSMVAQPDVVAFNNWHSTGAVNVANINNPIIDAGLEAARASNDEEVRKREFAKVQQELSDQSYYIYHTLQSQAFFIGPKIKGFPGAHGTNPGIYRAELIWV